MKKILVMLSMASFLAVSVPYVSAAGNHQDKTSQTVAKNHKKHAVKTTNKGAASSTTPAASSSNASTSSAAKSTSTPAAAPAKSNAVKK